MKTLPRSKLFSAIAVLIPSLLGASIAQAALEEVIVTANKRAESANDIGVSITALSAMKLAEQKLTSLEEITSSVPGLTFATSQQNTPILTLRGVGFNESSLGVYPATSLYVDEIPLPFPVMASHSSYDLERVEVLKGPQGVLFGTNSTGGAINFIASKPTEEFSYGGDISYGSYNRLEGNGFVNGALSESVTARLALQTVNADEWQKSTTTNEENGKEQYTASRLQLRFTPTDTSEINLNLNGWKDKSDPQALQSIARTPKNLSAKGIPKATLQSLEPFAKDDAESANWSSDFEPSGDKTFFQASLRGDFEMSDSITLTTLLAHSDYEQDQRMDADGSSLNTADYTNVGELKSTFFELRLAGQTDAIRWVIGANYEDSSTDENQKLDFSDNTSNRPGGLFTGGTNSIHAVGDKLLQDIESKAIFANVDYDLTEDLTLKLGARYTDTKIDARSCVYAPLNNPDEPDEGGGSGSNLVTFFNTLGTVFGAVPFDLIGVGDCISLNENNVPGIEFKDTLSEDNVAWRAGLDFRLSDDALVYANISQGYKAGSYPNITANLYSQLEPVTQESVLAYEAGVKMTLSEGAIQWNSAIFHYDYEDKQVRGKTVTFFGPLDNLVNVDESTITGFESDIITQLTDKLTLTAAFTYISSEVDKFVGFDVYNQNGMGGSGPRDLSGNDLPNTPELTYSVDLDYRTALNRGGELFMGLNVVGQSDSDAVFDADDLDLTDNPSYPTSFHDSITEHYFVVEEYYTVGARIGYESDDGRFKVMLWGKNITDEYYWNSVVATSEGAARIAGRPRTYGITVGYKY